MFLSFVQCTKRYIMPLTDFIIGIRLPINSQLRQNLNTSHSRYKCRPRHKISILAFADLFAFENKHWFKISFSHTM